MEEMTGDHPRPVRFREPRQERIHRRLLLIGPGPAAFYRDACRLLGEKSPVESTTHLVAHLLRDIESAIRDVLIPHDYTPPSEKQGRFKAGIDAILQTYGIAENDAVAIAWRGLPDRDDERWLGRLAHRSALAGPRQLDQDFRKFCGEVEGILDVVLERFEEQFTASFRVLEALIAKTTPTREDAKVLRGKVPNNLVSLDYFFGKVEVGGWLEILASEGFFQRPPAPVREEEKGGIRFPPWPESRYLVRMAAKPELQSRVVEIAVAIPETVNINAHDDLMGIALVVPAGLGAKLVPRLKAAMRLPYQLRLIHRVGALVSRLSQGGEESAAAELTEAFLTILPDPDVREVTVGGETVRTPPHPRTPFDEWVLGEFLKNNLPDLVNAAGVAALRVVCKALDDAVRLSRSRPDDEGPDDYSTIWHPAFDQDRGVGHHDLKSTLAAAVCDAAEALIQREPASVSEVIGILETQQWKVFHRMALHVLTTASDSALPLIEARLGEREKFEDRRLRREYMLLAQAAFPKLSPGLQETMLGWIEEGPDLDGYKRMRTQMEGKAPSPEEVAEYADRWRLEYWRALRDALPFRRRARYQERVTKYGEPEARDFLAFRLQAGWHGPRSPITGAELRQMAVTDIISRLKTWDPPAEFLGPSPEGLSRELSGAVEEDPLRFAQEAQKFQEVEPTYVRGLISGLRDAVNKERKFEWMPVLKLCQWVLEQPPDPGDRGSPFERDRGWGWTRMAIADLLGDAFAGPARVPFDLRQEVWNVLLPLTDDPDPLPKEETEEAQQEPEFVSLNTTRGKAMHALMRFALWVKEHLDKVSQGSADWKAVLDDMSEVREVLEAHLDPAQDPSLAIRSVYGQWLPSLVYLDRTWVKANLVRIFPTEEASARFRDAAWNTYVIFSHVNENIADLLIGEYGRAAERVANMGKVRRDPADPADHLAEHLLVLYWRGKIERDGPELTQFFCTCARQSVWTCDVVCWADLSEGRG